MKLLLIFGTCFLLSIVSYSQEFVIENTRENDLTANVQNSIRVLIENCSCEEIYVYSSNSKIEKGKNCFFIVIPTDKERETTLNIYTKKKNDSTLIGLKTYHIKKDFDYQTVLVRRMETFSDSISLSYSKSFDYQISAYPLNQVCWDYYSKNIIEFKLIVLKKDGKIDFSKNIGYKYNNKTSRLLSNLEIGDKIIFSDIFMQSPLNQKNIPLNPLSIKITN